MNYVKLYEDVAPRAWCCGSRGLAATLGRDQDRSSAAKEHEPYSCIEVLF